MRTSPLLFSLTPVLLFTLLAACTQEVTLAPGETSFTSYDSAVRQSGPDGLEVVVLVDDSAAAASARPLFASRIRSALGRFVGPTLEGEEHADAVTVVVKGASSGLESRVAFLADAPANAWKTPNGELRDAKTFFDAVDAAIAALPTNEGTLRFLDAIVDAQPSTATVLPRTIFLVATAHDDASTRGPSDVTSALEAFERPSLSILVDARSVDALGATDRQPGPLATRAACGIAVPSDASWPKGDSLPRLVAAASALGATQRVQWAEVCADDGGAGDLLLQKVDSLVTPGCAPLPTNAMCTVFVAPPISGADALCSRPELGLAPASSDARAHYARSEYASAIAGRPLCAVRELAPTDSGEGFRRGTATCGTAVTFTPSATPVPGSWLFLHCESTR